MTWLRDLDDDLINLDHVQTVDVVELADPQEGETHCVLAVFPGGDTGNARYLFTGDEAACRAHRDKIMLKLPMVRF